MNEKNNCEKLLHDNPKVDSKVIKEAERLEAQLQRIGVEIKPQFRLAHPLDGLKFLMRISDQK